MSDSAEMERPSYIVPHGHVQARAYVCIPVDESMATRSSVMGTLMDCNGMVQLPAGIEISDVLTWADFEPEKASELSAEQLSHALKIGDQMGDKESTKFAEALGAKLMDGTLLNNPERESLQTIFLSLNSDLKGLICQHLTWRQTSLISVLGDVLSKWPLAMQLAYFDALIATGSIEIPVFDNAKMTQDVISKLSHTSAPSKGLSKLSILSPVSPSTAAVVATALFRHQTSIDCLKLPSIQPGGMMNVLPVMSQLSQLTYLQLTFRHAPSMHPATLDDTVSGLAHTISKLRCLASFDLKMMALQSPHCPSSPPRKLRKVASAGSTPPAVTLDPVIKALAAAPGLTALALSNASEAQLYSRVPSIPCSGIQGPFLTLQELTIHLCKHCPLGLPYEIAFDSPFLLPVSPLPALSCLHFESEPDARADNGLVEGLLQQTALQWAAIELRPLGLRVLELLRDGMRALTALTGLRVTLHRCMGTFPQSVHYVVLGIAQLPALTYLHLVMPCIRLSDWSGPTGWSRSQVEDILLAPLSRITALKRLQCLFAVPSDVEDPGVMLAGSLVSHVLPNLTQLTRLELSAGNEHGTVVTPVAFESFPGLPRLPQLRHLKMGAMSFHNHLQAQDWLESLDLGHMTHLHLSLHPVNKGTLQCLGRCLRGAPEMQMVKVTATGVEAGWTQGILSMPYRGKYEFRYDEYEEGLGQVADKLAEQGFVLPCEDGPPYYMYDRMIRFKCPTIGHGEAATDDFNLSADFLSDESV